MGLRERCRGIRFAQMRDKSTDLIKTTDQFIPRLRPDARDLKEGDRQLNLRQSCGSELRSRCSYDGGGEVNGGGEGVEELLDEENMSRDQLRDVRGRGEAAQTYEKPESSNQREV